jgi:hypothetical protein
MNRKQRKTLEAIYSSPTPRNIAWADIESLFKAIGCETVEGSGSRVRFNYRGVVATFHRPHPQKEALTYQVRLAREYLMKIGVRP